MDARPGLALVQTMTTFDPATDGYADAALAAAWSGEYGFDDAVVWADTTDYIFDTWMARPPFNAGYPGAIVIDIDTMRVTALVAGGPDAATGAVQEILDAPHPCAEL